MSRFKNENYISLSSWNYGSFFQANPYYNQNIQKSQNIFINNPTRNIKSERIVKQEYFDNMNFSNYLNRNIEDKIEFRFKLHQKNKENLEKIKEYGKTFTEWKNSKKEKIHKPQSNEKAEEQKKAEDEKKMRTPKKIKSEVRNWKMKKIKLKKEEEEKKLKAENKKKEEEEPIIKKRKEEMNLWYKKKDEKKKKQKKIKKIKEKEEKEEKEKKEKKKKEENKIIFINWSKDKMNERRNKKKLEIEKKNRTKNKDNKRIKTAEIIGPFYYAKNLREIQKKYYSNMNKSNNNRLLKRSNTSKK